jgi:DNA-binding response OmpR family regulator
MKVILLIEDNNLVRENLSEFLELSGYEILSTDNGEEGIALAKGYKPDLILCDVLMPGMNGYEVLQNLLASPETNTIPFIFSTSNSEKVDYSEGMKLGADDYMVKPFDMDTLLTKVENCLKNGSLRQLKQMVYA